MKENDLAGRRAGLPHGRPSLSCVLIPGVRPPKENPVSQPSPPTEAAIRLAFIQARWHAAIVDESRKAFVDEIRRLTNGAAFVDVFDVPGAFEIPLFAKRLAGTGRYAATIGAAFVVDGGIYRHEFVAETVVAGLMRVGLDTGVPALSVVLTPQSYQETEAHDAFFLAHFRKKGVEAAQACLNLLAAERAIGMAA
jgi:6,7-dimethyl-8-ribityllumazine synthase